MTEVLEIAEIGFGAQRLPITKNPGDKMRCTVKVRHKGPARDALVQVVCKPVTSENIRMLLTLGGTVKVSFPKSGDWVYRTVTVEDTFPEEETLFGFFGGRGGKLKFTGTVAVKRADTKETVAEKDFGHVYTLNLPVEAWEIVEVTW